MSSPEIMNELKKVRERGQKIDRIKIIYKGCKTTYDFSKFKVIRSFGDVIRKGIIMDNVIMMWQMMSKNNQHK